MKVYLANFYLTLRKLITQSSWSSWWHSVYDIINMEDGGVGENVRMVHAEMVRLDWYFRLQGTRHLELSGE